MLKKSMGLSFMLVIGLYLLSCDTMTFSENEAKQIINQQLKSRETRISSRIEATEPSKCAQTIGTLITNGFVTRDLPQNMVQMFETYFPTDKGKPHIEKMFVTRRGETYYQLDVRFMRRALKDITEILIDKQNGIATVKYRLTYEPIEPLYALLCDKRQCGNECILDDASHSDTSEIHLKKYDKGWRVQ